MTEEKGPESKRQEASVQGRPSPFMSNGIDEGVLALLGIGLIETDLRGLVQYANQRAAEICRRSIVEMRNNTIWHFMPTDQADRLAAVFKNIFKNGPGTKETVSWDVTGNDGVLVSCEGIVTLSADNTGRVTGFACFIRDITEIRKTEAALIESEESYRKLVNTAPYSITIHRADDGKYVLVNKAFTQQMGFSREEALGRNAFELDIYASHEDRKKLVDTFTANGRLDDFETRFKTKSGEITESLMSARPITFRGVPCILYISTNIDALKKTQRQLMESEENARRIIESAPYAIVITRISDLTCLLVNEAFCQRTGYTREETIGTTLLAENIYTGTGALEKLTEVYNRKGKVHGEEIQHRAKDGRMLDSLVSISLIRFMGKECLLTISADLTEHKQAERELERYRMHLEEMVRERTVALESAQKELVKREKLSVLGQLTATVSHELRNPLGVIRSSAFYLQRKLADQDEKIEKHLKRIDEQVELCDVIVDDLLEYTRGRRLSVVHEDPTRLLSTLIEGMAESEQVTIEMKLSAELPAVFHDPDKIRRVMTNVISNAIQAIEEKKANLAPETAYTPALGVGTTAEADGVTIEIWDNGMGMTAETLSQAFEPLYTTRSKGTGIGLANVKKIISEHEGSVVAESEFGKGTKIIISLPFKRPKSMSDTSA